MRSVVFATFEWVLITSCNLARSAAAQRAVCFACVSFNFFFTIPFRPFILKSTKPMFANFFRFCRTVAVDDQSEIKFLIPRVTLPSMATNFVGFIYQ